MQATLHRKVAPLKGRAFLCRRSDGCLCLIIPAINILHLATKLQYATEKFGTLEYP
jgi:hypothetical protein